MTYYSTTIKKKTLLGRKPRGSAKISTHVVNQVFRCRLVTGEVDIYCTPITRSKKSIYMTEKEIEELGWDPLQQHGLKNY